MEWLTLRQDQIRERQSEIVKRFPVLWSKIIGEWQRPGPEDRAWLIYSANYLFRTEDIRWAIDPIRLRQRVPEAPIFDIAKDLNKLSFVVLTHRHADHLDFELIHALRHLPILWIVPDVILPEVKSETGLTPNRIIVPRPLQHFDIQGIRITPFTGLHLETSSELATVTPRGVPSLGYLIEWHHKRWLFPGDTRNYDASQLPLFGPVNGLFAHVWLGRGCALQDELPLLDDFCRFCLDLQPRRIILTHLEEFGRAAQDYWDEEHAKQIRCQIQMLFPNISVSSALLGDSVVL